MPTISRRILTLAAVFGLLAIMEAAMLLSVHQESQTTDEAYNLFAGYSHLTAGDYSICPAYPPLAKDVCALPLLAFHPQIPPMTEADTSSFLSGRIFLYSNRVDPMLFAARAAMTIFPLLLAMLVFLAAWEMFGVGQAFIALALIVFEPSILAHGPLATNDLALACCLFAAAYAFWRYAVNPSVGRLAVAGIAAGFTLASKHSGLILFPILFLLAVVAWLTPGGAARANESGQERTNEKDEAVIDEPPKEAIVIPPPNPGRRALRLLLALAVVTALSIATLWSFYNFRYNPTPGIPAPSLAASLKNVRSRRAATAIDLAARAHLLPEAYLAGLAYFYSTNTRPTYLLGVRYLHGVWFYFPTVLAIKLTLGFLLLLALAPFGLLRAPEGRREQVWMLVPAAVFLTASMTSNLNIGVRHILPVYPFLSVLAAAGAWRLAKAQRAAAIVVGSLLVLHAASSLRAYPNYIPYSNELWGGPSRTYEVLTDSNADWGQGLPAAKHYLETHAATPCWLAYFGSADPGHFELPCTLLTSSTARVWGRTIAETPPVLQGTVLVSATEVAGQLWGPEELNPYGAFRTKRPVAILAGSILVYQGSFEVPLASALSMLRKVVELSNHGEFEAALAKAHTAEALAPQCVDVQYVRGLALRAAGREDESRQALEKALHLAVTIHPEAQEFWVPILAAELSRK